MNLLSWLRQRDRNLTALRRAARAALVMPALFALGDTVIENANVATFAAFGSFAMLLLVDFTGRLRERLLAQAALAVTGAVLVCLGTLASRAPWLAALAMAVVAFGVLFAGVVSSVLAGATPSLLLAFILPVSLDAPASSIPDRLAGWGMASAVALAAVALLWPAPARDPLRAQAIVACRTLAARLRAAAASEQAPGPSADERRALTEQAETAVATLHRNFLATPYRPTGLGTATRALVRLVDELNWLSALIAVADTHRQASAAVHAVKSEAACVLERGADLLDTPAMTAAALQDAITDLRDALDAMEVHATSELPPQRTSLGIASAGAVSSAAAVSSESSVMMDERMSEILTSLDPSFRAQEIGFVISQIGGNIALASAAERRSWRDRLLGRQPPGLPSTLAAAHERAAAHVEWHSVWLHNSIRGAVGLGAAVLVAAETGVQHSFWVVLGALSVLRSNALSTGQNIVRALLGTTVGFVIGAALLVPIKENTTLLWFVLPVVVFIAGIAPAVISFAAGQAAFTVALVILYNIIAPAGWRVGLLRVEDVAVGCAVSLTVGLLFWPRGAGAALRTALAEAYADSMQYLAAAVEFGVECCDVVLPGAAAPLAPADFGIRAAAASRRLDDAFRSYLAERGAKPVPLAEVTSLVTGAAYLRLAGDAVLDLWQHDGGIASGDRAGARRELLGTTERIRTWYGSFAAGLTGGGQLPAPLDPDPLANGRLVDAVRRDLHDDDGRATAVAVRVIWTGDHLDAVRRMQSTLVESARTTSARPAVAADPALRPWLSWLRLA